MAIPKPEPIALTGDLLANIAGRRSSVEVVIAATPWGEETEYGSVVRIPVHIIGGDNRSYILSQYPQTPSYHALVEKLGEDEAKWANTHLELSIFELRGKRLINAEVVSHQNKLTGI